jgi:hypothetical protein
MAAAIRPGSGSLKSVSVVRATVQVYASPVSARRASACADGRCSSTRARTRDRLADCPLYAELQRFGLGSRSGQNEVLGITSYLLKSLRIEYIKLTCAEALRDHSKAMDRLPNDAFEFE